MTPRIPAELPATSDGRALLAAIIAHPDIMKRAERGAVNTPPALTNPHPELEGTSWLRHSLRPHTRTFQDTPAIGLEMMVHCGHAESASTFQGGAARHQRFLMSGAF
jgi:hypothetical protein